jgi:RNA polymerase sigma-70 factor (ECF subfamily)
MATYSDIELLEMFRGDNPSYAFNLLVRKYQKKIYAQVRRMIIDHDDTNDVVQDIFIKVWKGLEKFNQEAEFSTWLYRIAVNESLTFLKKKRTRFFIPIHDVEKELSSRLDGDKSFTGDEIELKLQKALLTLPEKQRVVFNLRYYDEMPYEEMSKVLETSVGALKASYHIAAKKVEDFLKAD